MNAVALKFIPPFQGLESFGIPYAGLHPALVYRAPSGLNARCKGSNSSIRKIKANACVPSRFIPPFEGGIRAPPMSFGDTKKILKPFLGPKSSRITSKGRGSTIQETAYALRFLSPERAVIHQHRVKPCVERMVWPRG